MIYYGSKRTFCYLVCEAAKEHGIKVRYSKGGILYDSPSAFVEWDNGIKSVSHDLSNGALAKALLDACIKLADKLMLPFKYDSQLRDERDSFKEAGGGFTAKNMPYYANFNSVDDLLRAFYARTKP